MVTTPFVAYATDDPHYQLSSAVVASVIEYYNVTLNHYFITMDGPEIHDLAMGVHEGWKWTGQMFLAYVSREVLGYNARGWDRCIGSTVITDCPLRESIRISLPSKYLRIH